MTTGSNDMLGVVDAPGLSQRFLPARSAANHGYLGAFNVVATLGLFAVIAAAVPIVLRIRGQKVESLWWVERAPFWSFGALLVVGLACVTFAYAALY